MVFAALGLTTAIGNVYADGGCPYSTSEFMQGMFAGNDGSFAMKNIKKAGDVNIKGEKYTVNVNDPNFDANLRYLGQFGAVQALFDEVRGRDRDFDNKKAVKHFAIDCVGDNVKFTVKARKTKKNPSDAKKFDFILTKAGDQHQQNFDQEAEVFQPQTGDMRIHNNKKERWNGSRWVRM